MFGVWKVGNLKSSQFIGINYSRLSCRNSFELFLASTDEEECLKLEPCNKLKAHNRYALRCCFSPDSK
jgi:hypothetical protein